MNLMLIKVFNFDISVFTWGSAVITNWLRSEIFIGSIFCVCTTFDEDADWSVPSLGNLQRDYQGKEVSDIMYRWSTYTAQMTIYSEAQITIRPRKTKFGRRPVVSTRVRDLLSRGLMRREARLFYCIRLSLPCQKYKEYYTELRIKNYLCTA